MERGGRRRTRLGGERGAEALAFKLQPGRGGKEPGQTSSHDHLMLGGRSGIIWTLLPCFLRANGARRPICRCAAGDVYPSRTSPSSCRPAFRPKDAASGDRVVKINAQNAQVPLGDGAMLHRATRATEMLPPPPILRRAAMHCSKKAGPLIASLVILFQTSPPRDFLHHRAFPASDGRYRRRQAQEKTNTAKQRPGRVMPIRQSASSGLSRSIHPIPLFSFPRDLA
jgi:hypothetical protein